MAWPVDWDRGSVLGAIEDASKVSLSADDSLPDMLIAKAQELGLKPVDLKLWIYDSPEHGWQTADLEKWARRSHLSEPLAICGHCGRGIYTADEAETHKCDEGAEA